MVSYRCPVRQAWGQLPSPPVRCLPLLRALRGCQVGTDLGEFGPQLVVLTVVRLAQVGDSLLAVRAFALDVAPCGVPLCGDAGDGATQLGDLLPGLLEVGAGGVELGAHTSAVAASARVARAASLSARRSAARARSSAGGLVDLCRLGTGAELTPSQPLTRLSSQRI